VNEEALAHWRAVAKRNITILSEVYNLSISTTRFGHCCSGHHQVGYNFIREAIYVDLI
jgi:hypothetical protein